ncbi:cellulose biosynthesis protein BcsO [Erwinia sp. E_sp_B04_8]|uniref:cellulose biosynthesis protein BcsO n=1 Tax=unclassified Erwinia TaxID=2622719 RepID=UPI0030CE7114
MKSYDDLQRFKEKTQTNHIEFKDMSEQTKNSDNTNWAIIKQLMTDDAEPTLGNGQRIDVAAPQPVGEDVFKAVHVQPEAVLQTQPHSLRPVAQQHSVAAFVARPVGAQVGGSLLDSISASLKPAAEPAPAAAETLLAAAQPDAFAAAAQPAQAPNPLAAAQVQSPQLTAQPDAFAAAAEPAQAPNPLAAAQVQSSPLTAQPGAVSQPASLLSSLPAAPPARTPVQAELPRFKQLFSTAPEPSIVAQSKDTLLQPLLERIASCR